MREEWIGFKKGNWNKKIDVRDFIIKNYTLYEGDESFLEGISVKNNKILKKLDPMLKTELRRGIYKIDTTNVSGINNFNPGYIDKKNELIVGLQTDEPLKRMINPYGGIRMVYNSLDAYKLKLDANVEKYFNMYRKTHNEGVFDVYTPEMRLARKAGLLTGLPDAYGRGRIIGDYRRISLYGIDYLIEEKEKDKVSHCKEMNDETISLRENISEQIKALNEMKLMAKSYGYDISKPAKNAKEAIQFLYFGYLAAVKENNGAAMSLGRTSTFIDIYIERDLKKGIITEKEAQELIDSFVTKLRIVRHLRTPEYDSLFSGDPTWVTESIGGLTKTKKPLVTKTSFRFLHTLENLGSAPEPNLTVLWSNKLPLAFKKYCSYISIKTDAIQYENDDIMRPIYGDDYGIACCVSAMRIGKDMQYFGARCNLAKTLLYSINGGYDEKLKIKVLDNIKPNKEKVLYYETVLKDYKKALKQVAKLYVDTMNIIHFMHDKYAYERGQMALHDTDVNRLMAFGIAGLSVAVDSLSAIKYAKVTPIRKDGITTDFIVEGDYPKYGNDDDRVDKIAVKLTDYFYKELSKHTLHNNAVHTVSVLTITSNVVYGEKTGSTPDGRSEGVAFAPGANPMHGRDSSGALASLNSVAKLNYKDSLRDGISNTISIIPNVLGEDINIQKENLVSIIDGYCKKGGHHLNVNVLSRETLIDAMKHPSKYPNLTIRISGYAVRFNRLTTKQQKEIIERTFHSKL